MTGLALPTDQDLSPTLQVAQAASFAQHERRAALFARESMARLDEPAMCCDVAFRCVAAARRRRHRGLRVGQRRRRQHHVPQDGLQPHPWGQGRSSPATCGRRRGAVCGRAQHGGQRRPYALAAAHPTPAPASRFQLPAHYWGRGGRGERGSLRRRGQGVDIAAQMESGAPGGDAQQRAGRAAAPLGV